MNDTKFTPGPWRFEVDGDTNYAKIFCSSNPHDGDNLRGYCGKHNAHLIAAAPELYEALNDLLNDCINFDGGKLTDIFMVKASRALAKARGNYEQRT